MLFRKGYSHNFNTVYGAAVTNGHTAANAGDDAAEQSAQQQVLLRQRRGETHVDGQGAGDQPGCQGIDPHRVDGIEGEQIRNKRVVILDDVISTGESLKAVEKLCEKRVWVKPDEVFEMDVENKIKAKQYFYPDYTPTKYRKMLCLEYGKVVKI